MSEILKNVKDNEKMEKNTEKMVNTLKIMSKTLEYNERGVCKMGSNSIMTFSKMTLV
jgi:hypothetical protein